MRKSLRINENLSVKWHIKDSHLNGQGRVLNISASGALLEANTSFSPMERCVFALESLIKGQGGYLPTEARLVWTKKQKWAKNRILCGVEFVQPADDVLEKLRIKVQAAITKLNEAKRFRTVLGYVLIGIMFAMTTFIVAQYTQNYENIQRSNTMMLSGYESQTSLSRTYLSELSVTQDMLTEAETLLVAARAENQSLKSLVSSNNGAVSAKEAELNQALANVKNLQAQNLELSIELGVIKQRLDFLEGNVANIQEGKEAVALYRNKLRDVKSKIKGFKRQAYLAKVAAQREKDRVGLLIGNNGFLMKDGIVPAPDAAALERARRLEIDVQVFK